VGLNIKVKRFPAAVCRSVYSLFILFSCFRCRLAVAVEGIVFYGLHIRPSVRPW